MITLFFRDLRSGLRRRWYLAVVGALVTLAAAAGVASTVPPTYEASASVILVPPTEAVPVGGNPYLYMGGLSTTVDVLSRSLSDEQTRHALLRGDTTLDYAADPDRTAAGPILLVTASGPTEAATMATLKTVVEKVPSSLAQIQSSLGIATKSAITSMTLTQDDKAKTVQKKRIRATLAVTAVTAAGALLLIGLIDGLLLRHASRKKRRMDAAVAVRPVPAPRAEVLPTPTGHDRPPSAPVGLVEHAADPEPLAPSDAREPELARSRAGRDSSER